MQKLKRSCGVGPNMSEPYSLLDVARGYLSPNKKRPGLKAEAEAEGTSSS